MIDKEEQILLECFSLYDRIEVCKGLMKLSNLNYTSYLVNMYTASEIGTKVSQELGTELWDEMDLHYRRDIISRSTISSLLQGYTILIDHPIPNLILLSCYVDTYEKAKLGYVCIEHELTDLVRARFPYYRLLNTYVLQKYVLHHYTQYTKFYSSYTWINPPKDKSLELLEGIIKNLTEEEDDRIDKEVV